MKRLSLSLAIVLAVASSTALHADPTYRALDLGTLGGRFSGVEAMSETGVVAGYSDLASGELRAFVWTRRTGMTDIGPLSGCCSPLAVSTNGVYVAGNTVLPGDPAPRAFLWTRESGMVDISDGKAFSWVRGVNNDGMVIGGWAEPGDVFAHAFVWTAATGMIDLGADMLATAINNRGLVAVNRAPATTEERAFAWTLNRGLVELDPFRRWALTTATAVNDDGVIVGGATRCGTTTCVTRATRWTRFDGLEDIDRGRIGFNTVALGIDADGMIAGRLVFGTRASHVFATRPNGRLVDTGSLGGDGTDFSDIADGVVVGTSQVESGFGHPFAWTRRDGMVDLEGLGGGGSATAVNGDGMIAGTSCTLPDDPEFACRAFVWTPPRDR